MAAGMPMGAAGIIGGLVRVYKSHTSTATTGKTHAGTCLLDVAVAFQIVSRTKLYARTQALTAAGGPGVTTKTTTRACFIRYHSQTYLQLTSGSAIGKLAPMFWKQHTIR